MASLAAFRREYMSTDVADSDDWTDFDARRVRYKVLWALLENTTYQDIHRWADTLKRDYSLYEDIRHLYNPTYRLGEFYKSHIWGGELSRDAEEVGAIPIVTEDEGLRASIAQLWRDSNWDTRRDQAILYGTILGDLFIRVVDNVVKDKVYLEVVYPGIIKEMELDAWGNVKSYTVQEPREHPGATRTVTYTEKVTRSGIYVVYETFLDNSPYAWPDNLDRTGTAVSEWRMPYGFVPLVQIQHNDVGLDWGWSEIHPLTPKVYEVDDLASKLSDQIRKSVDPQWYMRGVTASSIVPGGEAATADRPHPGREEELFLYGPEKAPDPFAMIADIDVEGSLLHIRGLLEEIERDYPELQQDIWTASGDASGRALRVARQRTTIKVNQRRSAYDGGLVRAQMMALSIGGMRGIYPYDIDSYASGALEHYVARRDVFDTDPLDTAEIAQVTWGAAAQAVAAGVSLDGYLRSQGWSDEAIADLNIQEPVEPTQTSEEDDGTAD